MAPVSKRKIEEKVFNKINQRFVESVVSLKDTRKGSIFLEELLAPTERIMLAKRLAIIFMLLEGASPFRIHKTLAVSTSTALRFRKKLSRSGFPTIRSYFRKKKERQQFWCDLEVLVRLGMPSMGRGRWAWLNEMEAKYRTKRT